MGRAEARSVEFSLPSLMWIVGTQVLGLSPAASQCVHYQEAGMEIGLGFHAEHSSKGT